MAVELIEKLDYWAFLLEKNVSGISASSRQPEKSCTLVKTNSHYRLDDLFVTQK